MTWHHQPLYAFDTETTGVDVFNDRIVTATICRVDPDGTIESHAWLLNPGIDIPEAATAVHGITSERARKHGEPPAKALAEISYNVTGVLRAGRPLVAFNAAFDLTILNSELARAGLVKMPVEEPMLQHVIDPFVLDRGLDQYRKGKRRLPDLCAHYGVEFQETHDATADAIGAAHLARAIGAANPHLGGYSAHQLFTLQQTLHRERQESFAAYLKRQGKDASDVSAEWPLRRNPERILG